MFTVGSKRAAIFCDELVGDGERRRQKRCAERQGFNKESFKPNLSSRAGVCLLNPEWELVPQKGV